MEALLVMSCAVLAAMHCSPASALNVRIECTEAGVASAAHLIEKQINDDRKQGYKFQLQTIRSSKVEMVKDRCFLSMDLSLEETTCHIVDPKPLMECKLRDRTETPIVSTCHGTVTVKDGNAFVAEYTCTTKRSITPNELARLCPDCNQLLDLNDQEGIKSVKAAVSLFNQNATNQRYYVLQDVGRMSSGYMMMMGMMYNAEYALVETNCPMGSKILPEACTPLCPRRARHAFCRSFQSSGAVTQVCEFYKAQDTTTLSREPTCPFGTLAGVPGPFQPISTCHSSSTDKAVHPICDWPSPRS